MSKYCISFKARSTAFNEKRYLTCKCQSEIYLLEVFTY
uniref:Uncharacterized protein n=1 Tax=Anguilla anguilla TaxID=7936 RepID=A0A0E9UJB6_ANGAN